MLKLSNLLLGRHLLRSIARLEGVVCAFSANSERTEVPLNELTAFTPAECSRILEIINTKNVDDLLNYEISKARARKLSAYKNRNGPLVDVRDILLVEGFGLKTIEKFYRSLLQSTSSATAKKPSKRLVAPFILPSMSEEQRTAISSSVSIRMGVSSVTWSRLEIPQSQSGEMANVPCQLTHWQHHDIAEKKLHLDDLVHRCLYIHHLVPTADCYLFENPQIAQASTNPGSVDQQNINIQKAQMTAMLAYALSARGWVGQQQNQELNVSSADSRKIKGSPSVFYLRRFLAARLFSHLVGTERVSSEASILSMMRTYYNTANADGEELEDWNSEPTEPVASQTPSGSQQGNVQFSGEFRRLFSYAERFQREFLGQTLLLNLAFVRLVLLQDTESISRISRGGNKTN